MTIPSPALQDLATLYLGKPFDAPTLKFWRTRLQTFPVPAVEFGFKAAFDAADQSGSWVKPTLAEVIRHTRTRVPKKEVPRADDLKGIIDAECTRGCAWGVVNMEDTNGASFVAHCDCKRGAAEMAMSTKMGVQGKPDSPGTQVAVRGNVCTWYIAKGCKVIYRGTEWSSEWRGWIDERRQVHLRDGMKPWEAQDRAVAEACHERIKQRGGLMKGVGR